MAEGEDGRPPGRVAALSAMLIDWMALLLMLIAATALALGWLLARTRAGLLDAAGGDAIAAAAIVGAAVPAWAAWQGARLHALGATTGQARLGLAVEGAPMRRVARFLLHPAATPLWAWLAVTSIISGELAIAVAGVGLAVAAALWTGVGLLARPFRAPLHDALSGARMVRR